ncbi:squalene synthase HpnC [Cerasicoccus arenae]|uniref:Squalene synthase HpnC n=1 Tax=Cerasicoccus arenae TaxID=424488 RepID=A0A8J3DDC5_9BACT|nr:squalene synthase HpnC [Cerasicoccus arenae]MBK1858550.1 squalene synthase HpnC [Cerasicoccus arenae]GHC06234.1 squalene synthase HpnC [Cerasicoccus arenae]
MTIEESYRRCLELTRTHYENFPVARLVPKRIRPYIAAVYAFARYADDIADEGWGEDGAPPPEARVARLDAYEAELMASLSGQPLDPETAWIFTAVADTITRTGAPVDLFTDLLSAFKQDCVTLRYESFLDVLDYCRRSANPVGRLVLILHNHTNEQLFEWSDNICTALQLANFWQDVGIDIRKDGRIYIPEEDWEQFGVTREMFDEKITPPELRECIELQVARAQVLFDEGKPLANKLPFPLSMEIRLTWLGGATILQKIKQLNYNTLQERPKIGTADKIKLLARALTNI